MKVELLGFFGNDRAIAESAWTSSLDEIQKKARSQEDVKRVVEYLIENKHESPLEQVIYKFYLHVPIFVSRQLMRHRLQSANEMSARYRTIPSEFYKLPNDVSSLVGSKIENSYNNLLNSQYDFYKNTLDNLKSKLSNENYKRVREVIRGVLGTAYFTDIVTSFNLRSLLNFFRLRLDNHAQPEIRQVASLMLQSVKDCNNCPIVWGKLGL